MQVKPIISYSVDKGQCDYKNIHGQPRVIQYQGRCGLHYGSVDGRAIMKQHALNQPRGTLLIWVLPMQELAPSTIHAQHARSNPFFNRFVILSDREAVQDIEAACFSWLYTVDWHNVYIAKFGPGSIEAAIGGYAGPERVAFAASGHFEMPRMVWQQLALTWDHEKGEYALYCNGVKVGSHDTTQDKGEVFKPGQNLFLGSPGIALGSSDFYDQVIDPVDLKTMFADSGLADTAWQHRLEYMYAGGQFESMPDAPSAGTDGWSDAVEFGLTVEELNRDFFMQGAIHCYEDTDEGLRIATPGFKVKQQLDRFVKPLHGPELDLTRTYLWSRRVFEGDLYLSCEFKLNAHGGLALLMTQAAGMQGEDFLNDYPLRTDGSMRCVCWEDIRNYHWEFYREMKDVRNDLVSHAVLKNPWYKGMAYRIEPRQWELDKWYTLTLLQIGDRVRGAIDGSVVVDFTDNGFDNNGPVLRNGRIALRTMMRTDMTFRKLRVMERPEVETV